jgi:YVTN family beta-propeller protein
MKNYVLFACVVFLAAFFSPKLKAEAISCQAIIGSGQPQGLAIDGNGNAWVAFNAGNYVLEISHSNCAQLAKVFVQNGPIGVAFDGANIWVTNSVSNTVSKIDASSGSYLATYPVGSQPRGVVFDGTNIWVANYLSNTVTKLQASNGQFLGNFAVGSGPYFMAVNGTNNTIWVANRNSNNVMELNQSGTIQNTIATDSQPQFLTFDGTNMWVTCYNSAKVDEISPTGVVLNRISVSAHGGPTGLTWDVYDGFIWGVTWGGYVFSINPNTSAVSYYFQGGGGNNLFDMAFDTNTRFLWATDIQASVVDQIVP